MEFVADEAQQMIREAVRDLKCIRYEREAADAIAAERPAELAEERSQRRLQPRAFGPLELTRAFASYLRASVKKKGNEETFEEWVSNRFGKRLFGFIAGGLSTGAVLGLLTTGLLVVDRLDRLARRGRLVLGHALLEGFDAFGEVAHQVGQLSAAAEQKHHHDDDDHPVPDT